MSANVLFIASILDRMEHELERIDKGLPAPPADRSFVHLVRDIARLDWSSDLPEVVRQIQSRAASGAPLDSAG